MKINWSDKTNWIGAAFLFVAFVLVANQIGEYFSLDKNSWSGWVQAIGSIAAILMSFQLVNKQHQGEMALLEKVRRDDDLRLLNILVGIVDVVFDFTTNLQTRADNLINERMENVIKCVDVPYVADIRDMFANIDIFKLPDATLAAEFAMLRRTLIIFIDATNNSQSLYAWCGKQEEWGDDVDEMLRSNKSRWLESLAKLNLNAKECRVLCRAIAASHAAT